MMDVSSAELRQRVVRGIEDIQLLLGLVPRLLDDKEQLEQTLRTTTGEYQRLGQEVAMLRRESERFRVESDQMVEIFSKTMNEMHRLSNEMVEKLRTGPGTREFTDERPAAAPTAPLLSAVPTTRPVWAAPPAASVPNGVGR